MKKLGQGRGNGIESCPPGKTRPEAERIYSAYKPVYVTDGIQTWVKHTHDFTVPWTEDDGVKFWETMQGLAPLQRIEDLQAMLAKLPVGNPHIALHADAIRAIHAEVTAAPFGFTRERLARLNQASEHWAKILVIRDLVPVVQDATAKKARRKITNSANAKQVRPNRRTVDHDEIVIAFKGLIRDGFTRREANGKLFQRGLASRATINRITGKVVTSER